MTKKEEELIDIEEEKKIDEVEVDEGEPEQQLVLKNRVETLENRVKMLQAEMLNFRKRKEEEMSNRLNYAKEDIILDLLPVLDNFERALALEDKNNPAIVKFLDGFEILYAQFMETLKKYEVQEIPSLDQEFDEKLHDAVLIGQEKKKKEGTILEVFTKGYRLKDKVIRHASVKVNKLN